MNPNQQHFQTLEIKGNQFRCKMKMRDQKTDNIVHENVHMITADMRRPQTIDNAQWREQQEKKFRNMVSHLHHGFGSINQNYMYGSTKRRLNQNAQVQTL